MNIELERMISNQIVARGISDRAVLAAIAQTPRHQFVDQNMWSSAYEDRPLSIGYGQTISQPYIVAYMSELLALTGKERVLEIGTGSGYQTAILAKLASKVYTLEIIDALYEKACERFKKLGYSNIIASLGDGYQGLKNEAPFDAIIATAAPGHIPDSLVEQLKVGGTAIIPVGTFNQFIIRIRKSETGEIFKEELLPVRFVPMVKKSG